MSERTEELQDKIEEENDPDDIMMSIMEVFSETEIVPDAGNYYKGIIVTCIRNDLCLREYFHNVHHNIISII